MRADLLRGAAGLILLALLVTASICLGSVAVRPGEVWAALQGNAPEQAQLIIDARIPRTLLGLLVGVGLAVAGCLLQGVVRNPLGDPGLLGVNAGAAAAVCAAVLLGVGGLALVPVAIIGAFVAMAAVTWIAAMGGELTPVRLVLAGAAISAALTAVVQAITLTRPDVFDAYRSWDIGSLAAPVSSWGVLVGLVVLGLVGALLLTAPLDALALGDEVAASLGSNPARTRWLGVLCATVLAGTATAVVGPIAFLGLAVLAIVRRVAGHRFLVQVIGSALVGPALLLAADTLGRVVARPLEIQVGVVTALCGAPLLLLVVRRTAWR